MASMSDRPVDLNRTVDVIIVGAGPAGSVLASRLSEQADKQILLLEAGADVAAPGDEHPDVLDPFCLSASNNPSFHWPGLDAELFEDRSVGLQRAMRSYTQGHSVGGGSNINGTGADRGVPDDYNEWQALGVEGWGWKDVLPYFKKVERDLDFSSVAELHGKDGPMPVRRLPRSRWAPFAAAIGEAVQRRGFPFIEDYTADFRDGFASATTNSLPERRVSASMAYLTTHVRQRPNLTILAHAKVDRISFAGLRADGVFLRVNGQCTRVSGREVILSCGALQSPALLIRSGVGPIEQLARFGIGVVRDLRGVGENLQNHPYVGLPTYLRSCAAQPADNVWFLQNWLRYSSRQPECDAHDMHLMAFNKCAWHELGHRVGSVTVSVFKPYSKGRVSLASADPLTAPKVNFNMLGDARDDARLTSGVRFALELLTDPAVARMRHEIFLPDYELVASLNERSAWNRLKAAAIVGILDRTTLRRALFGRARIDSDRLLADERCLRDFVHQLAQVQYHVCGTCRMGPPEDRGTVVDRTGRVLGMDALRVVDASIFPSIPRSNLQFPILMAAEKVADAIKAQWSENR
jgi:5-(hydroxymethyl)furfural/furfural oxidase